MKVGRSLGNSPFQRNERVGWRDATRSWVIPHHKIAYMSVKLLNVYSQRSLHHDFREEKGLRRTPPHALPGNVSGGADSLDALVISFIMSSVVHGFRCGEADTVVSADGMVDPKGGLVATGSYRMLRYTETPTRTPTPTGRLGTE